MQSEPEYDVDLRRFADQHEGEGDMVVRVTMDRTIDDSLRTLKLRVQEHFGLDEQQWQFVRNPN